MKIIMKLKKISKILQGKKEKEKLIILRKNQEIERKKKIMKIKKKMDLKKDLNIK